MNDNGAKTEAEIALAMREVAGALQHTVQARSESVEQISPYVWYVSSAADEIPKYWSEARDRSLREFWHTEPILAGAVSSMVSKIKTLGWTIDGPRRQVSRYQPLLAEAEFGAGWGTMISKFTEDILTTDKGGFLEVIRTGARLEDPIVGLAHLDSQRCWLSGDPEFPVVYLSQTSGYHKMAAHQVLHLSSMPSPDESMRDIGFCATSRVLRAAQILRDVEVYKREKLSSRPNRGMWLVQGTTQKRMDEAIASAMEKMDNDGLLRFAKPIVVAMMDTSQPLNVEQLDFASLPDGYDEQTTITLYVYMVALAMGVDAREFWPATASGATKADAEVQAMKARGKGTGDLLSMIERALNWNILPKSLTFHFDFQDDEEDRARAELEGVRIGNVVKLYAPAAGVEGLVSRLEARRLLADANVLPEEFVANEPDVTPDVTADDVEQPKTEEELAPAVAAPAPAEGEAPLPAEMMEKELGRLFGPRVRYRWPEDTYVEVPERLPFGMKHLRGRHDQSTHGHRRSGPGAGRTSPGKPSEHPGGGGGGGAERQAPRARQRPGSQSVFGQSLWRLA